MAKEGGAEGSPETGKRSEKGRGGQEQQEEALLSIVHTCGDVAMDHDLQPHWVDLDSC